MKRFTIYKAIILAISLINVITQGISQTLIAGWDFQTTTNGGTAVEPAPSISKIFIANFGAGTLYLDGTNGSSNWINTTPDNEITAQTGCYLNTGPDFSTVTTGYASLGFLGSTNCSTNGKCLVFKFSMTGKSNLYVSYVTKRNATGFTIQKWEYSTDGITWTDFQTITDICTEGFAIVSLNKIKELDNTETGYLKMTLTGATSATGYNKIDNIQFNADTSISTDLKLSKTLANACMSVSNGVVRFNATADQRVEIYNSAGLKLIDKLTVEGLNTIMLPYKGVFIVKNGNQISKIHL